MTVGFESSGLKRHRQEYLWRDVEKWARTKPGAGVCDDVRRQRVTEWCKAVWGRRRCKKVKILSLKR